MRVVKAVKSHQHADGSMPVRPNTKAQYTSRFLPIHGALAKAGSLEVTLRKLKPPTGICVVGDVPLTGCLALYQSFRAGLHEADENMQHAARCPAACSAVFASISRPVGRLFEYFFESQVHLEMSDH